MRKKYNKWYIDHMEIVERLRVLRIIHYFLFSPSLYYAEIGKRLACLTAEQIHQGIESDKNGRAHTQ